MTAAVHGQLGTVAELKPWVGEPGKGSVDWPRQVLLWRWPGESWSSWGRTAGQGGRGPRSGFALIRVGPGGDTGRVHEDAAVRPVPGTGDPHPSVEPAVPQLCGSPASPGQQGPILWEKPLEL